MTRPTIPERAPIGDVVYGVVASPAGSDAQALVIGTAPPDSAVIRLSGEMVIRYGIRYLGKPQRSVVPGLVAVDYGTFLTGDEAWDFLINRSNRYPRAEVFGYRNDGLDEMQYVKNLDFVQPIEVLAYATSSAVAPTAAPTALIAPDGLELPVRLKMYLNSFSSWAAWATTL